MDPARTVVAGAEVIRRGAERHALVRTRAARPRQAPVSVQQNRKCGGDTASLARSDIDPG
jgi:hypothetical protein